MRSDTGRYFVDNVEISHSVAIGSSPNCGKATLKHEKKRSEERRPSTQSHLICL